MVIHKSVLFWIQINLSLDPNSTSHLWCELDLSDSVLSPVIFRTVMIIIAFSELMNEQL